MSVTAFFVPDSSTTATNAEELYSRIRKAVEIGTGCPPRASRIFKLAFRHNGNDLEAEVGRPDPVGGRTVLAILDLGRESPYLIQCESVGEASGQVLVRKPVYSVTEFSK